jgi:hypothetical protein
MKDLNLLYNTSKPDIYFVVSAGHSIPITVPGTYNLVPINLDKIVAGYQDNTIPQPPPSTNTIINKSILSEAEELKGGEIDKPSEESIFNTEVLFTQNLSRLINQSRQI